MDKSHSGSASPAPLSSSPAQKSTPIPEVSATTESSSTGEQRRPEPPPTKSPRGTVVATELQDTDRNPLNVYAQAATSTISEWFGTFIAASVFPRYGLPVIHFAAFLPGYCLVGPMNYLVF